MNKRIKRIYVLMLILIIAVSAPVSTLAENIYTSGLYKYKIKGNGTVSIIDFDWNNNTGDLYIPSMLDGYVVSMMEAARLFIRARTVFSVFSQSKLV